MPFVNDQINYNTSLGAQVANTYLQAKQQAENRKTQEMQRQAMKADMDAQRSQTAEKEAAALRARESLAQRAVLQSVTRLQDVAKTGSAEMYGAALEQTMGKLKPALDQLAPHVSQHYASQVLGTMNAYQDPSHLEELAKGLRAGVTASSDPKQWRDYQAKAADMLAGDLKDGTMADPQFARQHPKWGEYLDRAFKAGRAEHTTNVNLGGINVSQPLTKPTQTDQQGKLIDEREQLLSLQEIDKKAKPEQFGLPAKLKAAGWGFVGSIAPGWVPPDAQTEQAVRRQVFNEAEQLFNAYRKLITGAAAPVAELGQLRQSFMNMDMNWNDFVASKDQYFDKLTRSIRLRNRLLSDGLSLDDPTAGEKLNELYQSGADANSRSDRAARAAQLQKLNMTKDEALRTLVMEGYLTKEEAGLE